MIKPNHSISPDAQNRHAALRNKEHMKIRHLDYHPSHKLYTKERRFNRNHNISAARKVHKPPQTCISAPASHCEHSNESEERIGRGEKSGASIGEKTPLFS